MAWAVNSCALRTTMTPTGGESSTTHSYSGMAGETTASVMAELAINIAACQNDLLSAVSRRTIQIPSV